MNFESQFFLNKVAELLNDLTNFSITELMPVDFEQRETFDDVLVAVKAESSGAEFGFVTDKMLDNISKKLYSREDKDLAKRIAGAINARILLTYAPKDILSAYAKSRQGDSMFKLIQGNQEMNLPLSYDYIASWLYQNNIIAMKGLKDSRAEMYDDVLILDLSKVATEIEVQKKREKIQKDYNEITNLLSGFTTNEELKEFFKTATPEEMIDFGKGLNSTYRGLLEGDAGNWEGYSVAEHTEAVIRNFEDAFADDVPEELHSFIKLMMLTHDLGKSKGRYRQKVENEKACREMCRDLGIDSKIEQIIQFIIGPSQAHTTNYYVCKDLYARQMLIDDCRNVLLSVTGRKPSEDEVVGLANICKILQTCDSGAYTAYGVIRDEKTDVYYRGGNYSWTKGFKTPTDARMKSDMRFIEPEERI